MDVRTLRIVGHDASRTGAPQSVLSFLQWLRASVPSVEVQTVLLSGGPLEASFARLGPLRRQGRSTRAVRIAADRLTGDQRPIVASAARRLAQWSLAPALGRRGVDLEVVNTLAALDAVAGSGGDGRRVGPAAVGRRAVVVHELDGVAGRVLPEGPRRRAALRSADVFLAAGPAVADMLVDRWGVAEARVHTVAEFVAPCDVAPADVRDCRDRSGTGGLRPLVVSCGDASSRKGADRFVDLIASFPDGPEAPVGVWVGGTPGSVGWGELLADQHRSGLGDRLVVVASSPMARAWIEAADVVVSMAREDPYPLVVLEAATAGRPVVATDSGGVRWVLGSAGCSELVVDQGDVLAVRDRVAELLADADHRHRVGERLRSTVGSAHVPEVVGPAWWSAMVDEP